METTNRKNNLRAIAFAFAALASTSPAIASAADGPQIAHVPYGDLNLASPAGVETLDRRLDRAVARVCGSTNVRDMTGQQRIDQCRKESWRAIRHEREVAIAKAEQRQNAVDLAENAPRGPSLAGGTE